jgi:hypothetical protein
LHETLPAGLLPGAQKRFVRWLFDHGQAKEGFARSEILCFLQLCAENPAQMIATSYLLQPEWQARFPAALTGKGAQPFLEWLDLEFKPCAEPLRAANFPPRIPAGTWFSGRSDTSAGRAPFSWRPARMDFRGWFARTPAPTPGVNIVGPLCFSGGVGQAARITAQSLAAAGVPISCRDIPGAPSDISRSEYLGLERFPTTLIHSPPDAPAETLFRHIGWRLTSGKCRIGIWYWELETLPREWAGNEKYLAEVWAPTGFIANAARRAVSLPVVEMLPAVHLPRPGPWSRKELGLPENRFVFLFMFDMMSTFQRKNPLAVVEAFRMAAARDASLVIKVSRGEADPKSMALLEKEAAKCGALVLDEVMPRERSLALISRCDCFVSLHRSEGFGLPLAESMLLGKPVIATRYSGNLDFMNDGNSLLVDFGRVAVGPDVPIYPADSMWAEPSVEHAAERLRWVLANRDAARALGEKARTDCSELLSLQAYGERMLRRISYLRNQASGDRPEELSSR